MKKILTLFQMLFAFHVSAAALQTGSIAKFQLYPIGTSGSSVWLLNVETGAISKCVSASIQSPPICSPWTKSSSETPVYDLGTRKWIVPITQSACNKEKCPIGLRTPQ